MNATYSLRAVLVAVVAIGASGCGEESSAPKPPANIPDVTPPVIDSPGSSTAAASPTSRPSTEFRVGGRVYECFGSAIADIEYAADRVDEAEDKNRAVKRELKRIAKRYRNQAPPADVLAEYNALLERDKSAIRGINKLIREHNSILKDRCG